MGVTIDVSETERSSLEAIAREAQRQGHEMPLPSEADARVAFGLADDIIRATNRMRKSIARDKSIRDAQGLLRISVASILFGQLMGAQRGRDERTVAAAAATAPAEKPMAYHTVMVECFRDGTYKVRVENGVIEYDLDGSPLRPVGVHAFSPSAERRTADQAAQDVIVGARMLSKAIMDEPLTVVP